MYNPNHVDYVITELLGITDTDLFSELKTCARIAQFNDNEVIFRNGDPVSEIMVCVDGIFKGVSYGKNGREELRCINSAAPYDFILPMGFKMTDKIINRFHYSMIAVTTCTVVAFPFQVILNLYKNNDKMHKIVNHFFEEMIPYYDMWILIRERRQLERYDLIREHMGARWNLLPDNTKALCMGIDISYWRRFKKQHHIE